MNKLKSLIEITQTAMDAARDHYRKAGLTYAAVPPIVGITGACENVDTLFRVGSRAGVPLFFTQTGQLSLEQALQHFPGMWTVITSGRDEELEDERHLRQFLLLEEEFDWTVSGNTGAYDEEKMYGALLAHIEQAVKAIAVAVAGKHPDILQAWGQDAAALGASLDRPFGRVSYDEAVGMIQKDFPDLRWGDDLKAEHEAKVLALVNGKEFPVPVFIMKYPKDIKFFNMKVSEKDPRVVLSADLILPVAGEGVGSAVREHDGARLTERLTGSTMFRLHRERGGDLEDFRWYLDMVGSARTRPHAGYGIGYERVLQWLLAAPDIRECSTFSLLARETRDWEPRIRAASRAVAAG